MKTKILSKKTSLIFLIVTIILLSQTNQTVFAQQNFGIPGLVHDVNNYLTQASKAAAQQQRRLVDVIERADSLITDRITHLNTLLSRIQNDSSLTSDEKTNLSGDIQITITGLNTLKTKIDADTDVQTALSDAKQIFTNFRIYEEFEPKIRHLIILNNIQTTISKLQALIPQLQSLINTLASQGKDVSQLTPLLNDVNTQLQTINTTITTDINTLQKITPNTPNPQTIFTQVQGDIQNIIKADFQKIRQDIAQMRPIFRQLIFPNTTGKPVSTGSGQ